MREDSTPWYDSWFSSPYYHLLYRERDEREASAFMDNLLDFLKLQKGSKVLDLACGRGRHARYLSSIGFDVTGVDLSEENIAYAKRYAHKTLQFRVHDMLDPVPAKYRLVLNLFTSFGYFEREEDDMRTVANMVNAVEKDGGYGVIDFLNASYARRNLIPEESKHIDGIDFMIRRKVSGQQIVKEISFRAGGEGYSFVERVKTLKREDFRSYLNAAGAHLQQTFGDYTLNPFDPEQSERLIMIYTR